MICRLCTNTTWPLLLLLLGTLFGCGPGPGGWGRVSILGSRLGPTSWTVTVADQGQGVELFVDGSPKQGQCRRGGEGITCWVGGLRPGYHRLAVTVAGKGTSRRSALSAKRAPSDEVFYYVLLDRFADGDTANNLRVNKEDPKAAHGGDLRGLRRGLSRLKRLGVTTLVLSPLWEPSRVRPSRGALPAYVGMRPLAPRRLSRALGTPRALMRLLRAARRRGLRVVLDLPRGRLGLKAYFAVLRTWLRRTFVDGLRIGPVRASEVSAWGAASAELALRHAPLLLVHHGPGAGPQLRAALARSPAGARLVEDRQAGRSLLGWTSGRAQGLSSTPTGAPPAPGRVRVLSHHRAPVLGRRLGGAAAPRAALSLTLHLLLAEIPQVYYADEITAPPSTVAHPDLESVRRRGPRQRLLRQVLGLRRGVRALRRGTQRLQEKGDLLVVARSHRRCRVIVVANRSDQRRRLTLDTRTLGWPVQAAAAEVVDRLAGRGYSVEKNRVTVEVKPHSVAVLVPAGSDVCRG